jgi:hypothetical protein
MRFAAHFSLATYCATFGPVIRGLAFAVRMTAKGVRRDKAVLSSGCKPHPAIRSSRKQPEQALRRRDV